MVCRDTVWYAEIQCGMQRYSVVCRDTVWYAEIQCGMQRYSVVCRDTVWSAGGIQLCFEINYSVFLDMDYWGRWAVGVADEVFDRLSGSAVFRSCPVSSLLQVR